VADGYYADDYFEQDTGEYGVSGDTAWTWQADPVRRPVDPKRLHQPGYSVLDVRKENPADVQVQKAFSAVIQGLSPHETIKKAPTRVSVKMQQLVTEENLEREYDVAAELLRSPRGVDLTTGGEP